MNSISLMGRENNMNSISLMGRITAEPELKTTGSGISVCKINIAVRRPHAKDATDFLPVVFWRKEAEYVTKYHHKGDMIGICGMLVSRKYTDRDGKERVAYEIMANTITGAGKNSTPAAEQAEKMPDYAATKKSKPAKKPEEPQRYDDPNMSAIDIPGDDDLPF